ncbi:Emopamil-binding protein [Trypanosoma melophagium]|uniref:Emopamil-binding protein n=1 Tax=Trypanosoma melophagium TaxID=715481 RepID=UPI00351A560E|nr:Emopamil-binding protein [Trypanosoma melophagium]
MPRLPLLAQLWFIVTAPVVIIDAIFVLSRSKLENEPHPLAETSPFNYWVLYATYDKRYAPNDDAFVVVQSWLNLLEVSLGLFAVFLSWRGDACSSIQLAFAVSVMTLYKTVMYLVIDIIEGGKYTQHNTPMDTITMVVLPSLVWVVMPAIVIKLCMQRICVVAHNKEAAAGKQKKA